MKKVVIIFLIPLLFLLTGCKKKENKVLNDDSKVLVVYFSAQNHTEKVAQAIAQNLKADTFKVVPLSEYTDDDLDYNDSNSRVYKEHENENLRDVALVSSKVNNWEDYDLVLIGYPIWWGIAAWPLNNFVKDNDFTGKTVIPFCTSASSGLGSSGKLLSSMAGTGNWLEGKRFASNASLDEIKSWTDSLK